MVCTYSILGSLLDKFGCKPFLMLNLFGQLIGDIGIMINFAFIEQLPLEFFFIETLYGLFGGAPVWYLSKYCNITGCLILKIAK